MALTDAQLEEAKAELKRRETEQARRYSEEYARRQAEAEERLYLKMEAAYPGIDRETMYNIFSDMRDFYE